MADPMIPTYGEHGFETRRGRWEPPAVIDDATRIEAGRALGDRNRLLEAKASTLQAKEWILSLVMLTGGKQLSTDDAKAKGAAYAAMLVEYPAVLFTRENLQKAAGEFKFFPAYSELAERLDKWLGRLKREQKRLQLLAAVPEAKTASVIRSAVRPMPGSVPQEARAKPPQKPKASAEVSPASPEQIAEWTKALSA